MKRLTRTILAAIAALTASSTIAAAAPLRLTTSFDVLGYNGFNRFDRDENGFIGSTFFLDLLFADGTVFGKGFAQIETATATISGATAAASNAEYEITDDIVLFATDMAGIGNKSVFGANDIRRSAFLIGSIVESLSLSAAGSVAPKADGTVLTLDALEEFVFLSNGNLLVETRADGGSDFRLGNFRTEASRVEIDVAPAPVPLPAALPLMLVGMGGFAALRRRRKVA